MQVFEKAGEIFGAIVSFVTRHGRRIERSNAKTISYIKKLNSLADGELKRIVRQESGSLLRDTEKIRAARFLLGHRG